MREHERGNIKKNKRGIGKFYVDDEKLYVKHMCAYMKCCFCVVFLLKEAERINK